MARRCNSTTGKCVYPRANWWKTALGVNFSYPGSGSGNPFSGEFWQLIGTNWEDIDTTWD